MGVYPIMYALMDVERFASGLTQLLPFERHAPGSREVGAYWLGLEPEHVPRLTDLAQTLRVHASSLFDASVMQTDPDEEVGVAFDLVNPTFKGMSSAPPFSHQDDTRVTVALLTGPQRALTEEHRATCVVAEVSFDGAKREETLPLLHRAWPVVRAFLHATQPVHAFVVGDALSPSEEDHVEWFQAAWCRGFASTFFGPELVRRLPVDVWTPAFGWAVVERIGEGVWVALPGGYSSWGQPTVESSVEARHQQAAERLTELLATVS